MRPLQILRHQAFTFHPRKDTPSISVIDASVLVVASSDKPNSVCCHTLDCTITPLLVLFQPVGLAEEDLSHCQLEQIVFQFNKVCLAPEFALIDVTVCDPNRFDIRKSCIPNQAIGPIRNAAEVLLCFDLIQARFHDPSRTPMRSSIDASHGNHKAAANAELATDLSLASAVRGYTMSQAPNRLQGRVSNGTSSFESDHLHQVRALFYMHTLEVQWRAMTSCLPHACLLRSRGCSCDPDASSRASRSRCFSS